MADANPAKAQASQPAPAPDGQTPSATTELTPIQKKLAAKAEKAARRAGKVNAKDSGTSTPPLANGDAPSSVNGTKPAQKGKGPAQPQKPAQDGPSAPKQRRPSVAVSGVQVRDLPERLRRDSRGNKPAVEAKKTAVKEVAIFSHLYGQSRKQTLEGSSREVHTAVLELGLQLSSYVICGSQARCVAMLLALKAFISSYSTPPSTSLPRHLSTSALSPQLTHLRLSRPFSITCANSIRWLKNLIATIDPSVPEPAAKAHITTSIDTFIRERFVYADRVIAATTGERIPQSGAVILTYAKSAVVSQTLLAAHAAGKRFRVIVADSRPLHEGRALVRVLSAAGISVTYILTSALPHVLQDATLCLLGAHAVLGSGSVYSRVGTALVGMAARDAGVPVVVCAESVKFTERVALDSVVMNELGGEEELFFGSLAPTPLPSAIAAGADGKGESGGKSSGGKGESGGGKGSKLNPAPGAAAISEGGPQGLGEEKSSIPALMKDWREKEGLQVLNVMYDVLPAEYIDMIVTEHGCVPPGCAPMVGRMNVGG